MKVSRSKLSRIKLEWELKQMVSAYVAAERYIINENSKGNDPTGSEAGIAYYTTSTADPESFFHEVDEFGNLKPMSDKEILMDKARKVRELLDKAIANDEFEKAEVYQRTLDALKRKYDNL